MEVALLSHELPLDKRAEVIAEVENWKKNPPEGYSWYSELNNFHTWLPSDYLPEYDRFNEQAVTQAGWIDTPNHITHRHSSVEYAQLNSELYLSQTPRQFMQEIDRTIENLPNISLNKIKRLNTEHYKIASKIHAWQGMSHKEEQELTENINKSMEFLKALYEYVLPVYIELRVKGYSHYDLTG